MKHLSISLTLLFCVLLVAGCGGNVRVTGTVTFPDGEPLTTGQVVFENEKISAIGRLSEDGTYTLGTNVEGNGIPRGQYRVFVTGAVTYGEPPPPTPGAHSAMLPPSIPLIDRSFRSAETSGLVADVTGRMTFDITVTRPGER